MSTSVTVENGKYTVLFDDKDGLRALRYGDGWQELHGNKLVYCLAAEIERLREIVNEVHSWAVCAPIATAEDMAQNFPAIIEATAPSWLTFTQCKFCGRHGVDYDEAEAPLTTCHHDG